MERFLLTQRNTEKYNLTKTCSMKVSFKLQISISKGVCVRVLEIVI